MRPVIGIPCAIMTDSWYGPVYGNYVSYLRAVEAAGAVPLLIHLSTDEEVLRTLYRRIDGLLLAGGDDVHPLRYGEAPHPALQATSPAQDAAESTLLAWARADGKPVLGICRGMQLLNVAFGGTLYQDIAAQRPGALNHRVGDELRDWLHLPHQLVIDPQSWLAERLGTTEIGANSLHHQGIKDLAPGLRAVAHAPDGLIEAVESVDGRIVGVQCHPEMLWEQADPRWLRLFAGFSARCVAC